MRSDGGGGSAGRSPRGEPSNSAAPETSSDASVALDHSPISAISLPTGGGALRGIGETFTSHPATGTCSLTVPIETPRGRSGFSLALSLTYDSGAGNGPFGLGFRLSAPAISRKTDKGLPRYLDGDGSDTYLLAGAEDLVPVRVASGDGTAPDIVDRGAYLAERYRPRVEGLFSRIERWVHRATGDVHWRAFTRDNVLNVYGRSPSARVSDPDRPGHVFTWLLEETHDDHGNVVRYTYKREDGEGVDPARRSEASRFRESASGTRSFVATAQTYLKRVQYGNRTPVVDRNAPAPEGDDYLFELVFDYGEHDLMTPLVGESAPWTIRPDPFSNHRAGFEIRTYRLCRRVLVFHRFAELGAQPCLVRSLDLRYDEARVTVPDGGPPIGPLASYLVAITRVSYDRPPGGGAYLRVEDAPLELDYTRPVLHDRLEALDRESRSGLAGGMRASDARWVDLDGEGLPGVLFATEQAWFYKRNLGEGAFEPPALQHGLPRPARLSAGPDLLLDLGGDGKLDLVSFTPPLTGYFERTDAREWAPFVALRVMPNIDFRGANVRFVDVDGDGLPDLLVGEHEVFVWYRSRGKEGFDPASWLRKPRDEERGAAVVFADGAETIHLADISGDGLLDVVRVRNGEVCYWPNQGYGCFGPKITLDGDVQFDTPEQFDARRMRFADLDGSGTSDLVYLGRDGVRVYFNLGGNALAPAWRLESLPAIDSLSDVNVVDLLGTGTQCLVWSSQLARGGAAPVAYVDLLGGEKPHLLRSMVNNLGAETYVAYRPSTRDYLDDRAAGRPWITRLPMPVQVIAEVRRKDTVADTSLVTRFAYHHGFFDGVEREFRGFACVEQWDAESFGDAGGAPLDQPPVRTVTWFHTGVWLQRERIDSALAREHYQGDPLAPVLPRSMFPGSLTTREEREAARALRGRMLRQEIYAEDGTPEAPHPYVVSEANYEVRLLQHREGDVPAVVFAHERQRLNVLYERAPTDPRLEVETVIAVDAFGNPIRTATVAYPRRAVMEPEQGAVLATVREMVVANAPDETDFHRIGVPVESTTCELVGLGPLAGRVHDHAELDAAFTGATVVAFEISLDPTDPAGQRRPVARERRLYYRDELDGPLPLGEIGRRALVYEQQRAAFTTGLVASAFGGLVTDPMLAAGGYVLADGIRWARGGRAVFDRARFYQAVESIDPLGGHHRVTYDGYSLLVLDTEDAVGNHVTAGRRDAGDAVIENGNDYRVLAPALVMDANRNLTAIAFDTRGMVVATAMMGKEGTAEGDTLADPTTRFEYDMLRFRASGGREPVFSHELRRERHGAANTRFRETYVYSDGSGREAMKKESAEPGPAPVLDADGHLVREADGSARVAPAHPRWVGTGRTVYDNKGNVVKKYEPYFSSTFAYEDEDEIVEWGVTPILRYDPLGRLVRTDHPNGTHTRLVVTAWRRERWDENDCIAGTPWFARKQAGTAAEQRCAALAFAHRDTPTVEHLDPLGRAFLVVADNAAAGLLPTRVTFDIKGNRVSLRDPRGNVIVHQVLDMIDRPARVVRADAGAWDVAGEHRVVAVLADPGGLCALRDVANKPMRTWDETGVAVEHRYDALERETHLFVTDAGGTRLVERTIHGELHPDATARNLRTRVFRSYDGAGMLSNDRFDLDGNLVESTRRLARAIDRPDWSALAALPAPDAIALAAEASLEAEELKAKVLYDACARALLRALPDGTVIRTSYNQAGLVESIELWSRGLDVLAEDLRPVLLPGGSEDDGRWTPVITNIDYDARGRRVLVEHGNGTRSRATYDQETFRLIRQVVERPSSGATLQDLSYERDPVGNVVAVTDAVSWGNPAVSADGLYRYDAIYQLVAAEGREHPGQQPGPAEPSALRLDHPNDLSALRRYRETYQYDDAGNLTRVAHAPLGGGGSGWTRRQEYAPDSNRLVRSNPGDPLAFTYAHDDVGRLSGMAHLHALRWDHASRLVAAHKKAGGGDDVFFAYDARGVRVRKVYVHGMIREERIYLGPYEVYRRWGAADTTPNFERQTVRVIEADRTEAIVETKTIDTSSPPFTSVSRWRYQVDDHLGSSTMELDHGGRVIGYEQYHPYGTCAFRATDSTVEVSARRYRYTGHERDEETGLDHRGARYYAAWLGRWTSCDPKGTIDGANLYRYARNNPLRYTDPDGTDAVDGSRALDTLRGGGGPQASAGSGGGGSGGRGGGGGGGGSSSSGGATSRAPTTGPSGTGLGGVSNSSSATRSTPHHTGALGVFESISDALHDAASWAGEWLPGIIAGPIAGLLDILGGFVRLLGGLFSWNGTAALRGLEDMGRGALRMLGLGMLAERWHTVDWSARADGDPTSTLPLPDSLRRDTRDAAGRLPSAAPNARENGMHAWHAGTNAAVAHRVGLLGALLLVIGGLIHESPIDWESFDAEQRNQGTVNHILDSLTDIIANVFGIFLGLLLPRSWAIEVGVRAGNYIPGPGDPDPAVGGDGGTYTGKPWRAWGTGNGYP
ncbi:SpvB/TcaC N-terminal domain-containing protein [Sorangium sp. So ce119]|uniref:SpvB/TcaC N-terminal domain-containing protein n=1 Tax=Sorangium sp. So ce119 TaxID=3133279 RepID=UPI003F61707E